MKADPPNFWRPLQTLQFNDVDDLRVAGTTESVRLDFKAWKFLQNAEKLREHLCAMANGTPAGGRFVFGAESDAADKVIARFEGRDGTVLRQETSRLRNAAFTVDPPVHVELQFVPLPQGGDVLVAEVRPSDDGPHQVNGCYYTRRSDGIGRMTHLMVRAAVEQRTHSSSRIGLPNELFTKDPFQDARTVLAGIALVPSYSAVPLVQPWDIDGRQRLAGLIQGVGATPEFATPDGIPFLRRPNSLGFVRYDGCAWETVRFVDPDGRRPRQRLPIVELKDTIERVVRQLSTIVANLQESVELSVRVRLWTLPVSDGLIELGPEDAADPVEHYEGFRQRQMPVDGLILGTMLLAGELAKRSALQEQIATRFCAQLPLYCHTVMRTTAPPQAR